VAESAKEIAQKENKEMQKIMAKKEILLNTYAISVKE
jgi:hypothetical protein